VFHLGQNQVLDSDAMLLHVQVGGRARHITSRTCSAVARLLMGTGVLSKLQPRTGLLASFSEALPVSHPLPCPAPHDQERQLHPGADPNWRTAFNLPASADTGSPHT
jgi:hypothetical protein